MTPYNYLVGKGESIPVVMVQPLLREVQGAVCARAQERSVGPRMEMGGRFGYNAAR